MDSDPNDGHRITPESALDNSQTESDAVQEAHHNSLIADSTEVSQPIETQIKLTNDRTADNGDEAGSLDEDSFEEWHPRGPPTKPTSVKLLKPVKQDKKQSSVKDQDKKQVKKPQNNGT